MEPDEARAAYEAQTPKKTILLQLGPFDGVTFEAPLAPAEIIFDLRQIGTWSTLFSEGPEPEEGREPLYVARYAFDDEVNGMCAYRWFREF